MTEGLDALLPQPRASASQIIDALTGADQSPEQRAVTMLWFEIIGFAVRGQEPYQSTVKQILAGWENWIAGKLPPAQRDKAAEVLARVEGQMLMKLLT